MREKGRNGPSAAEVIELLGLAAHPEGGFYRETFRDRSCDATGRAASALIYFLLAEGDVSAWHRIDAAEVWHYYAGVPLLITVFCPGDAQTSVRLGNNLAGGERPQCVVPAFDFAGFELAGLDRCPPPPSSENL